jgi:zinc protease
MVSFGSSPENADKLAAATFEQVAKLRKEGPTADELAKEKEIETRELEVGLRQNGYWLQTMRTLVATGGSAEKFARLRQRVAEVSADDLRAVYAQWLVPDHYTRVTLRPETAPAPAATK